MTDDAVLELLRATPFSFVGTVERLGTATMTEVPIDKRTAVVHVDQVLHAPSAFAQLTGSRITVQLAVDAKRGEQLAFFANGVAFGSSVAVAEVGRLPAAQVATHLARAEATGGGPFEDLQAELEADRLREHAKDAAAVVVGRVMKLEKVGTAGWSDHDPDWWKATVGVQHLESGRRRSEEIEILYPNSMGVRWYQAPKPRAGQMGVFILHPTDRALRPLGEFQILHPEDLQPLQHLDPLTSKGTKEALTPKGTHERMIRIVNMIPQSLSGETNQDSDPSIAVNPENTNLIAGTAAFTPAPMGGAFAPIYVSTDGGNTWALNMIAPGNTIIPAGYPPGGTYGTSVAFADTGGHLYVGSITGDTGDLQILRTADVTAAVPMTSLLLPPRAAEGKPWVVAASAPLDVTQHESRRELTEATVLPRPTQDRVYVGNQNFNTSGYATIDLSLDAATAPPPAGFGSQLIENVQRGAGGYPSPRIAVHPDGTVYAVFERLGDDWWGYYSADVVITRDDAWGGDAAPFRNLGASGSVIALERVIYLWGEMGQERTGLDLAIAVDPHDSSVVWVAWCDLGSWKGDIEPGWTLHVRRSTDRGETWSNDLRTIMNAKNPALAINSDGELGLLYQAFTGTRWVTQLELTVNGWATAATTIVLHTAPSSTPTAQFLPYLGDSIRMIAIGTSFYGVFCGNNTPDPANFPNGVTYQRAADWTTTTLLATDGVTSVAPSIDPFFFHLYGPRHVGAPPGPIQGDSPSSRQG